MTDHRSDMLERITSEIEEHIPVWLGASARLKPVPRQRTFRHSFFLYYQVDTQEGGVTILVKIARKPWFTHIEQAVEIEELRSIARQEYTSLEMTWRAFKRVQYRSFYAVQPFAYLESCNAIVMRKVEGISLKHLFFTPNIPLGFSRTREQLLTTLEQAGQWLRLFHQYAGGRYLETFSKEKTEQKIKDRLDSLLNYSDGQVEVKNYRRQLHQFLDKLNGEVPTALLHGDYHFSNIFFTSNGRICAMDPFYKQRSPVYEDLASLIVHPQTRSVQIFTGGRFAPPQLVKDCRQAVLEGYFGIEPFNPEMVDFYCALHILHQWSMDEKKLGRTKLPPIVLWPVLQIMRGYFTKLLVQYLQD